MDLVREIYGNCFNPQKVKIYDGIKQTYEERYVPCGKCYHCRITKVNEWCTRMLLQSMDSLHTYFCTLTYSPSAPKDILRDCDAVVHNINYDKKFQSSPLVLCKKHVQDFFKRLRKNTGIKFQYFCCGEYGDTYARPHYHFILWSDSRLTCENVQDAWTIYGHKIGDVDFQDMNTDAVDITHSFKYVCKYVQKGEFDLKKLKTYKYHVKNCKQNYSGLHPDFRKNIPYVAPSQLREDGADYISREDFSSRNLEKDLYIYQKKYSPFFLCSKKPAIGYDYFERNKTRFAQQDYRIFELSGKNIFPTYYIRKTKEYICPYKCISSKNEKPTSYSNIPNVLSLLVDLQNCISFNEGFCCHNATYEYCCNFQEKRYDIRFSTPKYAGGDLVLPQKYFCFYDCKNHYTYSLAPDFMYNVCDSHKNVIYRVPIAEVIKDVKATYEKLLEEYLLPMFYNSQQKRTEKLNSIIYEFGSIDEYMKQKKMCTANMLALIEEKQKLYKKRKNIF